jgi:hypothetical protein
VKMPHERRIELQDLQPKRMKLTRYRAVQFNFRVSTKLVQIISMLARFEGRSASALIRELLTLGLTQYVNIYYRTPQLVRMQQLRHIMHSQLERKARDARAREKRNV